MLVELAEHVDCSCHCDVATFLHFIRKEISLQEFTDDGVEDLGQNLLRCFRDIDDVKMPHESWSQGCSASTRRCGCAHNFVMVDDFLEEVRPIVDDVAVQEQPQELNWRLRPILFHQRHIYIVDKYDALVISFGTNHLFASLFHQF